MSHGGIVLRSAQFREEREARFPAEEEVLTEEVRARLEELGYLNGAAGGDDE